MTLILIWALLSPPYDRMLCSMWLSKAPTQAVMASAGCVWTAEQAAGYVWRAIEIGTGKVICERPATELPDITCELVPLDHYLLRVYQPSYIYQYCTVEVAHTGSPTQAEAREQCPDGSVEAIQSGKAAWKQVSSYLDSGQAPAPPAPICPLPELRPEDIPASVEALATHKDYFLLDFELLWWYGVSDTTAWQNQYDHYIYDAGILQRVPPKLLKGIFGQESQFWPLWAPERKHGDEVGLGQLTDLGADLALRYSPGLYNQFCPVAAFDCDPGYDHLADPVRKMMRDLLRSRLMVTGTPKEAALQAAYTVPTWAQILAATYCAAGEIVRPAGFDPSWDYAVAAYHSGPECVRDGEICEAGMKYLEEVKN
jgi:hypothetical protein